MTKISFVTIGSGVTVSDVSMQVPADTTLTSWLSIGRRIFRVEGAARWWIGDWMIFGDVAYPENRQERVAKVLEMTGYSRQTLYNLYATCINVAPEDRHPKIPFWTHTEVARLPPEDQRKWLALAADEGLTRVQLRQRIRGDHTTLSHLPPDERVLTAGRLVVAAATAAGDAFFVPAETLTLLADAVGLPLAPTEGTRKRTNRWRRGAVAFS